MSEQKRPSSKSPIFFVGKDGHGSWVVQDQEHLCGGLFVDRAEAVRFALFENGQRPQAVIMVPGILELDLGGKSVAAPAPLHRTMAARERPGA